MIATRYLKTSISSGTHGLGDELWVGTVIRIEDLKSDNVLDPDFSPAVVEKMLELYQDVS